MALAGCGVVYTVPSVDDGSAFSLGEDSGYDVRVIDLTAETARAANLDDYVAARLPLAFQPEGVERAARRIPDIGSLPAMPRPSALNQNRPGQIETRLPPRTEPQPYRIGVADALVLSLTDSPTTVEALPALITAQSKRNDYVVQDDGAIAIPDVGRVRVAGLTVQDAEARIFEALLQAGIDPAFSLEIAEFNSKSVTIAGMVRQPTLAPITLKPLYLHEAVSLAGGDAVAEPETGRIQITRRNRLYQVPLERLRNDPSVREILLQDGDTVFVTTDYRAETAAERFRQEMAQRDQAISASQFSLTRADIEERIRANALANLESDRDLFKSRLELGAVDRPYAYLAGEVLRTKRIPLPFEQAANLADILFDENRIDIRTADYGEIYVLRAETDPELAGGLNAYHLDADNAVNLAAATQLELRPNDVVFISEQPITSWNRVISQVLPNLFLSAANLASQN